MPSSTPAFIPQVIDHVIKINPMSIFDIGIGWGKWGGLFREYLDIRQCRIKKSEWIHIIDGIEIFPDYIQDHQKYIYNNIIEGDICDYIDLIHSYDLIFMGDVLEHIEKNKGIELINKLTHKCKYLILSVPLQEWPQGEINGNIYERHISEWRLIEFEKYNIDNIHFSIVEKKLIGLIIMNCERE
jgi:hypothetical protein